MKALLNTKKLYPSLLATPLHYLYVMTIALLLMLLASWWHLLFAPSAQTLQQMQHDIDKKVEQTFSLKKSERELATLHTSLAELKTQLASYGQSVSSTQSNGLAYIADTALEIGMLVNSCRMHTDHAQSSSKHQIIFDCKGSFDQIISFLSN